MECASFQRLGISANADDEELQADAKAAAQLFN
jgi:hypothetical protein